MSIASSCACGENSSSNDAPPPLNASRTSNDPKGVRGSISTNNSSSAHRVRKHSRRESSSISESVVRAINGIEPKELKELQNVRGHPPQRKEPATNGSKSAPGLTPGSQDQGSSQLLSSSHHPSEEPYESTISSSSGSVVANQVDLSSSSLADMENGGVDHPGIGLGKGGIYQLQNRSPSQETNVDGPNRKSSTASVQLFQRAYTDSSAIQSQPALPQRRCACGANASQATASRSDVPNPTCAGASYNGNQNQPSLVEQQQAKTAGSMSAFPAQALPQYSYSNLPVTTTRHAIPQRCSTLQQPLTPEELVFLRRNPGFISRAVSHLASSAMSSTNLSAPYNATMHNCACGDTCNCLGCIAHPYNPRTLSFVQSLQDLMTAEDQFESQNARRLSFHGQAAQDMTVPISAMNIPVTTVQSPVPASTFGSVSNRYGMETGSQPQEMTDFVTNGEVQDQFPVSPTGFYHVDYPIGSCGADCFCGDGCAGPGCLRHSRNGGLGSGQASNSTSPELDATLGSVPWSDQQQLFSMPINGS